MEEASVSQGMPALSFHCCVAARQRRRDAGRCTRDTTLQWSANHSFRRTFPVHFRADHYLVPLNEMRCSASHQSPVLQPHLGRPAFNFLMIKTKHAQSRGTKNHHASKITYNFMGGKKNKREQLQRRLPLTPNFPRKTESRD